MTFTISLPKSEDKGNIGISTDLSKEFDVKFMRFAYIKKKNTLVIAPGLKDDDVSFEIKNYIMKGKFVYERIVNKDLVKWLKSLGFSGKIEFKKIKNGLFVATSNDFEINGGINMRNITWFAPKKPQAAVRVTDNKSSGSVRVSFNSKFMAKITTEYIKLGFDEDNKVLTIKEIEKYDETDKEILKIIKTKRSKSGSVNLKNMSDWFNKNELIGLFEVDYDEEENLYVTGEIIPEDNDNSDDE